MDSWNPCDATSYIRTYVSQDVAVKCDYIHGETSLVTKLCQSALALRDVAVILSSSWVYILPIANGVYTNESSRNKLIALDEIERRVLEDTLMHAMAYSTFLSA